MIFAPWILPAPDLFRQQMTLIRTAVLPDMPFVQHCAEQEKERQGFVPNTTISQWLMENRVLITWKDGERIGYAAMSGGSSRPAVLRMNTVIPHYRGRGFGKLQTLSACCWAHERSRWLTLKVRTRSDLERQVKINASLGGRVIDTEHHKTTRGPNSIETYEIPLLALLARIKKGEFGA